MENGYDVPKTTLIDALDKLWYENNARAMNALLCGLVHSELTKVIQCTSVKELWDKLKNIYEGDEKFKKAKLQNFQRNLKL